MAMGRKSFFNICEKGTLKEVRRALANGADVNERGMFKKTCLMLAVSDAKEPLVSLLLQQPGIQVNVKDIIGWTALHYAAFHNYREEGRQVIKLLLNFPGIDTEMTNDDDQTPLMLAKEYDFRKVFVEEYEKKMVDDYAKAIRNNLVAEKVETAEINQMTRKRKRESSDEVPHQVTSVWERLRNVKTRQKSALEEAAKKRKEKEEELVKMEEKMVEELDKEFEDKMAALVKEKQGKRTEIAEKVKVKKERQVQVDQETLAKLEKEHNSEREELMKEMWGQAEERKEDNKQPVQNHHDQPNSDPPTPPPAPDCPICFEPMTPPTRIFQCGNGHLVCGGCKPKLQVMLKCLQIVVHYFTIQRPRKKVQLYLIF